MPNLASTSKLGIGVVAVLPMDTNKIREMITELQAEIDHRIQAVKALEKILLSASTSTEKLNGMQDSVQPILFGSQDSYLDIAVKTIEANGGKATTVRQILDRVRALKGNPDIERRSVEATLFRHLKVKGEHSRIVKVGPGKYTIRRFPRDKESVA